MDEQRQQQINEAAEQFANAVRESYRTVAERGESAQQLNAELTQQFYNAVLNNLRQQTEEGQRVSQELREQQERQQEAGQSLMQESAGVYMDFINSLFSVYQGSTEAAERSTEEAQRTSTEAAPPEMQEGSQLPLENYDSLTVKQISERLDNFSAEELRQLRTYEAENKNRKTLLQRVDERIEADSTS